MRLKVSQMSPAMQQDFENGNLNFADSVYYKRFEITGIGGMVDILKNDDSIVDGVRLDCFIFTPDETADGELDAFLTAYDAEIVRDDGTAANLKARVRSYVDGYAADEDEKRLVKGWIAKTVERMKKDDEEGAYRGILLLSESLSDYCLLRDIFYFGSKQTISRLKNEDAEGYRLFRAAVTGRTNGEIAAWALYAAGISEESGKTDE